MNKKHIFFDMDGTLLNDEHKILEQTIVTINKLIKKNVNVSIATGRSLHMVWKYLKQLNLNAPIILANGNYIYYPKENKMKVIGFDLHQKVKNFFIEYLKKYGGTITWYNEKNDYVYSTNHNENKIYEYSPNAINLSHFNLDELFDFFKNNTIHHLTYMYDSLFNNRSIESVVNDFKILENQKFCKVANTSKIFIDCDNLIVDKCNAIKFLTNEMNIDDNDVITFGDSNNDYYMTKYFKNSVAMGNAIDKVKSEALVIIESNNNPGIANYLNKLFSL